MFRVGLFGVLLTGFARLLLDYLCDCLLICLRIDVVLVVGCVTWFVVSLWLLTLSLVICDSMLVFIYD